MNITLTKATLADSENLHAMQILAFKSLLDCYQDYETNPGTESLERVQRRFTNPATDHYFIVSEAVNVGQIRIYKLGEERYRISLIFILPEYRGHGYAQAAIAQAEKLYPSAKVWELDTIKQELRLTHLYEKMGYELTGTSHDVKEGMTIVDYEKHIHQKQKSIE